MTCLNLQVKNGILVQFADDTCLICCGEDHNSVSQMLGEDLCLLHSWVGDSRMSFNTKKSSVTWFTPRSQRSAETPPVTLDGSPLMSVVTQRGL